MYADMARTQVAELNFVADAGGRPSSTTRRATISSVGRSPSSSCPNRTSSGISRTSGNGWQPDALVSCRSTEAIESIPVSVTPLRELRYAPTRDLSSSRSASIDHGGAADLKRAFFSSCEARGSSLRWLCTANSRPMPPDEGCRRPSARKPSRGRWTRRSRSRSRSTGQRGSPGRASPAGGRSPGRPPCRRTGWPGSGSGSRSPRP